MSAFWGYAGADWLAIAVIGGASAVCLACALLFVKRYSAQPSRMAPNQSENFRTRGD